MLIGKCTKNMLGIKAGKLTDHPVAVGSYPGSDGQVMAKFTHHLPGTPGNLYGDNQCGNNHYNAQWLPNHAPTDILEQPEYNMEVFHFSVFEWNMVNRFLVAHDGCFG